MAKPDLMQVAAIAAAVYGLYQGGQGQLPAGLQKIYDKYIGGGAPGGSTGKGTGAGGGAGGGAGASGCSSAAIASWAQGIRLPTWVGSLFCGDFGRLPQSIAELDNWGQSKGYLQGQNWVQPAGS